MAANPGDTGGGRWRSGAGCWVLGQSPRTVSRLECEGVGQTWQGEDSPSEMLDNKGVSDFRGFQVLGYLYVHKNTS